MAEYVEYNNNLEKTRAIQPVAAPEATESGPSMAERSRQRLTDLQRRADNEVDRMTTSMGRGMEDVGEAISAAGNAAGASTKRAGQYLRGATSSSLAEDLSRAAHRHPGVVLCAGVGLGVLIGRALRSTRTVR